MQPTKDGRVDRVPMQGGIVHLPAEFREVAWLANQAGLEGYRLQDLEIGLNLSTRATARADLANEEPGWPATEIQITYRKPEISQ